MSSRPEKRTHPRYPVQKIATYHWQGRKLLTVTLDLGLGGMKINSHFHLPKDACVGFQLVLGADSIRPKGRVAYSDRRISGIQFIEISMEDLMVLHECLTSLRNWPRPREMMFVRDARGRIVQPGEREAVQNR